ncbi:FAD-dependent monooxygenase [Arthrobacter sp. R1-13]
MLAHGLGRYGAKVLLLERRVALTKRPRATGVSSRSMEVLRMIGLEQAVRVLAEPIELSIAVGECLMDPAMHSSYAIAPPSVTRLTSPAGAVFLPQDRLESVLTQGLEGMIMRGCELIGLEDDSQGVSVIFSQGGGKSVERRVRARFVVGADGGHSQVREVIRVARRSWPATAPVQHTSRFRAPIWSQHPFLPRHSLYVLLGSDGNTRASIWPVGGDSWVIAQPHEAGQPATKKLIRELSHLKDQAIECEPLGSFSMGCEVAERFVVGRVCLVGDAAHTVAPRGGTGLNSAIQDSFNLAWRLGWAIAGWADSRLMLEGYERERQPLAVRDASIASMPVGLVRDMHEELNLERGGRISHHWIDSSKSKSTLDLVGAGITVFSTSKKAQYKRTRSAPHGWAEIDPSTARKLGLDVGDELLTRPDGVVMEVNKKP